MNKNTIKKVNVYPKRPIFFGVREIRRDEKNIDMTVGDIFQCLLAMARVEEVTDNGVIQLTLKDFYGKKWDDESNITNKVKINPANGQGPSVTVNKTQAKNTTKVEEPKQETEAPKEEPKQEVETPKEELKGETTKKETTKNKK